MNTNGSGDSGGDDDDDDEEDNHFAMIYIYNNYPCYLKQLRILLSSTLHTNFVDN
jgi:hypothetical protein